MNFGTLQQILNSMIVSWPKTEIFKIQDGGRPPFWKSLNRHISVKNRPILMKFGTLQQILNLITATWPKIEIFKIQDGGGHHIDHFLAITHQPIVRFQRNFAQKSRTACRQRPRDKICKFLKSKMADGPHFGPSDFDEIRYTTANVEPDYSHVTKNWNFKIQDGGGRHLESRFFGHNSSTDCLISDKFCTKKQNDMPTKAT